MKGHPFVRAAAAALVLAAATTVAVRAGSSGAPAVRTAAAIGADRPAGLPRMTGWLRSTTTSSTTSSTSTTTATTAPSPPTTARRRVAPAAPRPAAGPSQPAAQATGGRSGSFYMTCYGPPEFPRGSSTATGYPAGPDEIAVDPHVIPYHSRVHIEGWGDFVAADTGGAIKGHRIDLWRSSCSGFPNPTVTASW